MGNRSRTTLLGLAILSAASTVSAVSLASFTPRINNLPSQCQAVYTTTIEGCKPEDFGPSARCSQACVNGLVKITEAVDKGCGSVDVGETSIIGVFQNGIGIQSLCPGTVVTTISSSTATSTRAPPPQTSAQPATSRSTTTTTTSTSSSTSTTLATSTSQSQSQASQSSATSSQAIAIDPNVSSTAANASPTNAAQPSTPSRATSAETEPTRQPNSQLSNVDSGGGSPFDVIATGMSTHLSALDATAAAFLAMAFLIAALT